jgi:hypothetical protein
MKRLGDMFSEEDKKKAHPVKEGEGADDKMYVELLGRYKRLRHNKNKQKEAQALLRKAMKLAMEGDVSKKAKTAGAYI